MSQNVNSPSHYNSGKIEVIEALEDWKLGFHRGNVVKYVARAGKKNLETEIEDLEKAQWYLAREIELLKARESGREPIRPNDMNPRAPVRAPYPACDTQLGWPCTCVGKRHTFNLTTGELEENPRRTRDRG